MQALSRFLCLGKRTADARRERKEENVPLLFKRGADRVCKNFCREKRSFCFGACAHGVVKFFCGLLEGHILAETGALLPVDDKVERDHADIARNTDRVRDIGCGIDVNRKLVHNVLLGAGFRLRFEGRSISPSRYQYIIVCRISRPISAFLRSHFHRKPSIMPIYRSTRRMIDSTHSRVRKNTGFLRIFA